METVSLESIDAEGGVFIDSSTAEIIEYQNIFVSDNYSIGDLEAGFVRLVDAADIRVPIQAAGKITADESGGSTRTTAAVSVRSDGRDRPAPR